MLYLRVVMWYLCNCENVCDFLLKMYVIFSCLALSLTTQDIMVYSCGVPHKYKTKPRESRQNHITPHEYNITFSLVLRCLCIMLYSCGVMWFGLDSRGFVLYLCGIMLYFWYYIVFVWYYVALCCISSIMLYLCGVMWYYVVILW